MRYYALPCSRDCARLAAILRKAADAFQKLVAPPTLTWLHPLVAHPFCSRHRALPALVVGGAALASCCWGLSSLRAELTWAQKSVELQADAKAAVIEARFRFTNGGPKPVDVVQVQTSCGCTTAALDQRHYEPGQSGEIVARFTVGERVGLQKKTILVSTTEGPVPTALSLVVHIPELVRIQPAFAMWKQGEANAPKTIQVEATQDGPPIKEMTVLSSNTFVSAKVQPVLAGRKYQIIVTPDTTEKPLFATLAIRCRIGAEEKTFHAFASVPASVSSLMKRPAAGSAGSAPASPAAPGKAPELAK